MKYDIQISSRAEQDIKSAADYIEHILLNPKAADLLLNNIDKTINSLRDFPKKHPLTDDPVLKSWDIRFVKADNYLIFYTVSELDKTVYIVRVLYKRRNWTALLRL